MPSRVVRVKLALAPLALAVLLWLALDGPDNATERAFHLKGYGLIVLIDPQGKVAGFTLPAILQPKHLDRILAGQPSNLPALNFVPPSDSELSTNSPAQFKKDAK